MPVTPNPADARLIVSFYTATNRGKAEETVRITNPFDNSEVHALAASMSHRDVLTDEEVSYAQRFPQQYAAFKSGKDEALADEEADLVQRLATIRAARRYPEVSDAAVRKAADEAASAAALEAARGNDPGLANAASGIAAEIAKGIVDGTTQAIQRPNLEAMTDDELRDWITEKGGKPRSNATRELLLRTAQEIG